MDLTLLPGMMNCLNGVLLFVGIGILILGVGLQFTRFMDEQTQVSDDE